MKKPRGGKLAERLKKDLQISRWCRPYDFLGAPHQLLLRVSGPSRLNTRAFCYATAGGLFDERRSPF